MHLIEDAGQVWHKLASVRLSALGVVMSAVDAGWTAHITGNTPWLSLATAAISAGAGLSRLIAQPALKKVGDCDG